MGRSVRISEQTAKTAFAWLAGNEVHALDRLAVADLRNALARLDRIPKTPKKKRPKDYVHQTYHEGLAVERALRSRKPSKEEKRDETARIREACLKRAAGRCECGCGCAFSTVDVSIAFPEMDHFFGRGKVKQSVETCWILRADCHREKTNNRPDAATWLRKFIEHCKRNYVGWGMGAARWEAEARLRFVEARAALPAAPRVVKP